MFIKRQPAVAATLLALTLLGCGEIEVNFVLNREGKLPEAMAIAEIRERAAKSKKGKSAEQRIKEHRARVAKREEAMRRVLFIMFGTPDEPHAWGSSGLDPKKLAVAAGPPADKTGLYRKHCAHCHGVSGDGAGPTARFLNPYPRDYRQGVYKFKSTAPTGAKPTRGDLQRTIREGVNGTAMPSFKVMLREDEIEALAEYVIYLSMRGVVEQLVVNLIDNQNVEGDTKLTEARLRSLIAGLPNDPELNTPLPFAEWQKVDIQWREYESDPAKYVNEQRKEEENLETVVAQILELEEKLKKIMPPEDAAAKDGKTKDAKTKESEEVQKINEALNKLRADEQATMQKLAKMRTYFIPPERDPKLVAASRKIATSIFTDSTRANCASCHGPTGLGDGGQLNFDEWNSKKHDAMAKGKRRPPEEINAMWTLPMQRIKPRNLRLGIYRGGRRPVDIYRRIALGINGTPMPENAAVGPRDKKKLQPHEIWALVDFVLSLPYAEDGQRQHHPRPQRPRH